MISNHNKNEKLKVSSHLIKMYSVIYISAEGTIRLLNTKIKEKLGDNKIECLLAKCAYCGVDHTNSNSSIGPWKWDENNNCTFVSYHVEIDHAANCSCPLNPHSYISICNVLAEKVVMKKLKDLSVSLRKKIARLKWKKMVIQKG